MTEGAGRLPEAAVVRLRETTTCLYFVIKPQIDGMGQILAELLISVCELDGTKERQPWV